MLKIWFPFFFLWPLLQPCYHCMMVITTPTADTLHLVADALIVLFEKGYRIVLLEGEMGSGKTTLVSALCRALDVTDVVNSPTFALVHEYRSPVMGGIFHMDFYRLSGEKDLLQIGLTEYLDSGNICLIEWPEIGKAYYTMPHIRVSIQTDTDNIRNFNITTHDAVDA